jgi:hypothetical protein
MEVSARRINPAPALLLVFQHSSAQVLKTHSDLSVNSYFNVLRILPQMGVWVLHFVHNRDLRMSFCPRGRQTVHCTEIDYMGV